MAAILAPLAGVHVMPVFLPEIPPDRPLRILTSACLIGTRCGWEGDDYTEDLVARIAAHERVSAVGFCPENFSFGTPRAFSSIHGGDGHDVLDGRARVLSVDGADWTEGSVRAAEAMLEVARKQAIDVAIMMDISPSCGSHVVYLGDPAEKNYQRGAGVAAALLMRNGYRIIAQRDTLTLELLLSKLDPSFVPDPASFDFEDHPWYRSYFKSAQDDEDNSDKNMARESD